MQLWGIALSCIFFMKNSCIFQIFVVPLCPELKWLGYLRRIIAMFPNV